MYSLAEEKKQLQYIAQIIQGSRDSAGLGWMTNDDNYEITRNIKMCFVTFLVAITYVLISAFRQNIIVFNSFVIT
jgi:hypothetical protein